VAYYPFNGDAKDASSNANHGTPFNVATSKDRFGRVDGCYSFLGAGSSIVVPHSKSLSLQGDFSISLWKNGEHHAAKYENYVTKRDGSGNWNFHLGGSFSHGPSGCAGEDDKYLSGRRSGNGASYELKFSAGSVDQSVGNWVHVMVTVVAATETLTDEIMGKPDGRAPCAAQADFLIFAVNR
jgi:hypothetical protein